MRPSITLLPPDPSSTAPPVGVVAVRRRAANPVLWLRAAKCTVESGGRENSTLSRKKDSAGAKKEEEAKKDVLLREITALVHEVGDGACGMRDAIQAEKPLLEENAALVTHAVASTQEQSSVLKGLVGSGGEERAGGGMLRSITSRIGWLWGSLLAILLRVLWIVLLLCSLAATLFIIFLVPKR